MLNNINNGEQLKKSVVILTVLLCSQFIMPKLQSQDIMGWGGNQMGELGIGSTQKRERPVPVGLGSHWNKVDVSVYSTYAIKRDKSMWAWGLNSSGQLGNGNLTNFNIPVQIGIGSDWKDVSAYNFHVLAIKSNGSLWAWGLNSYGSFGNGGTENSNTPVQIGLENNWATVSVGNFHSLALKNDSSLWAWGYNLNGELGIGGTEHSYQPIRIDMFSKWIMISAGASHSAAIKMDGSLWAWGKNTFGSVGDGTFTNRLTPVRIGNHNDWVFVACSDNITFAIKQDGSLWAWGDNNNGKFGDGTTNHSNIPKRIGSENDWKFIAPSPVHTIGIKKNGSLWGWGLNDLSQVGDGTNYTRLSPVLINDSTNWGEATASFYHSMAMTTPVQLPYINVNILDFDILACNNYAESFIIISNEGKTPLHVSDIIITGVNKDDFYLIDTLPISVPPDKSVPIKMAFFTNDIGHKSAYVTIYSNSEVDSIKVMPIHGRKEQIELEIRDKVIDLGVVCPNENKDTTFLVINKGTMTTPFFLSSTGGVFLIDNKSSVYPSSHRTLYVIFKPKSAEGAYSDQVTITDSLCGTTHTFTVKAIVKAASISAEGFSVETEVGTTRQAIIKVHNTSGRRVIIPGPPDLAAPFSVFNTFFPLILDSGKTAEIIVRYDPKSELDTNFTVRINAQPCGIFAEAVIQAKAIQLPQETELFASVGNIPALVCESSLNFSVEIENVSDKNWRITNLELKGTDKDDFVILQNTPITINSKSKRTLNLQFLPNSIGIKNAIMEVETNAPNSGLINVNLLARKDSVDISPEVEIIDLGEIETGETADTSLTIFNYGNISNTALISEPTNFILGGNSINIAATSSSLLNISFAGRDDAIEISENIQVKDSICGRIRTVQIKVKVFKRDIPPAKEPKIALSKIHFDDLYCDDESSTANLIIENTGDTTLSISNIEIVGMNFNDFTVDFVSSLDIPANDNYILETTFKPSEHGNKTAEILISSNDKSNSVVSIDLEATKHKTSHLTSVENINVGNIDIDEHRDMQFILYNTGTISSKYIISASANLLLSKAESTILPGESDVINFSYLGSSLPIAISEWIAVADDLCGYSSEILITGNVIEAPPPVQDTASCSIELIDIFAVSGEIAELEVRIADIINFDKLSITEINFDLIFNSTVLSPIDYQTSKINNIYSKFAVKITEENFYEPMIIKFNVGLGSEEISTISISDVYANDVHIVFKKKNATFTLQGICREGGTRLIIPSGISEIHSVSPNPSADFINVDVSIIENSPVEISIFNFLGERLRTKIIESAPNDKITTVSFDIKNLASGQYYILMSTPTIKKTKKFIVKR